MAKIRPYEAKYDFERASGEHMGLEAANVKKTADTVMLRANEANV